MYYKFWYKNNAIETEQTEQSEQSEQEVTREV